MILTFLALFLLGVNFVQGYEAAEAGDWSLFAGHLTAIFLASAILGYRVHYARTYQEARADREQPADDRP